MAQPAQIERRNKGMADSLIDGHRSPRKESSTSCFPYCSLGKRWKEAQPDAGLPTKTYCNRKEQRFDDVEKAMTLDNEAVIKLLTSEVPEE